jgi:hypothetical protein
VEVAASIAVLPFENPSGDPEQEYFARGFVEDVVTELSRFPTLEVVAFTMARREAEAARLVDDLEWTAHHSAGINRMMTREVGLPVCLAVRAFGRERHAEAIRHLEPVRDVAARFGGSHAQRDALTLTLIEAAIRGGHSALARHYTAERTVHKPASDWGWRVLARTAPAPGLLRP